MEAVLHIPHIPGSVSMKKEFPRTLSIPISPWERSCPAPCRSIRTIRRSSSSGQRSPTDSLMRS